MPDSTSSAADRSLGGFTPYQGLENPEIIQRRQLDRLKDVAVAQMKADGV